MNSVTRIYKNLLPHISRIFSAAAISPSFRFVLLASFFAFAALNVWMKYITVDTLVLERINVLSAPFSGTNHIALGKQLYTQGNEQDAIKELLLAEHLSPPSWVFSLFVPTVLGAQSESTDVLNTWKQQHTYNERAYQFWKTIIKHTPDYRDAYVTLASLCYILGKNNEAITYVRQANIIDPNNEAVKILALQLGVVL